MISSQLTPSVSHTRTLDQIDDTKVDAARAGDAESFLRSDHDNVAIDRQKLDIKILCQGIKGVDLLESIIGMSARINAVEFFCSSL